MTTTTPMTIHVCRWTISCLCFRLFVMFSLLHAMKVCEESVYCLICNWGIGGRHSWIPDWCQVPYFDLDASVVVFVGVGIHVVVQVIDSCSGGRSSVSFSYCWIAALVSRGSVISSEFLFPPECLLRAHTYFFIGGGHVLRGLSVLGVVLALFFALSHTHIYIYIHMSTCGSLVLRV